ncbi:MAG: hypothetical protein U0175_04110 [Caldilineaceae bacterium]
MSRILYFCPDFPQPSGGVKTLYRHVARLAELGFTAVIVHQKRGFRTTWHNYDVPMLWLEDRPPIRSDDVCVFPEVMADTVRQTQQIAAKRVVFALSWLPTYNRLRPGERWSDLGVTAVLAKSPTVKRYLEWSMDASVTLIPEYVAPERYFVQPDVKQAQIAYTTRKDNSGEWLQQILTRKGEPFTSFQWLALRNFDEENYAHHLRHSVIYLPTTMQEAMHVSLLEAMACGCLVVGYAGIGGHDYLVAEGPAQNCILVENGNLPELGLKLEEVIRTWSTQPQAFAPIITHAVSTAKRYQDPTAERETLREFYSKLTG